MTQTEKKYKAYSLRNITEIPQIKDHLTHAQIEEIKVVSHVLPFRVNNYITEELIHWDHIPNDPIYQLTFPQREMLTQNHYKLMKKALEDPLRKEESKFVANQIRHELNPHPDGQVHNVPEFKGQKLTGIQHKYHETVLFFPAAAQTCHAYCTFCFRWPQFVGFDILKFAMKETDLLIEYLQEHPEVTDVVFTGGDPMIMSAKKLSIYMEALLNADLPSLRTIRIGTKSLSYWPYRYLSDPDADDILRLFEKMVQSGYHLAFMAHFNHPRELIPKAVKKAIRRIRNTGAEIRTQSPILKHINDQAIIWERMWKLQVRLGCIPYYMFVARDTGAQEYFAVELERAWQIFRKAYQKVSGVARTVRGPSMSAEPGKIQVLGVSEIGGKKVFNLMFLQGRDPDWVQRPFFAQYDPDAIWLDELEPAQGNEKFFFEKEKISF